MEISKQLKKKLLFDPLYEKRGAILAALLAALLLGASQAGLVFIAGPVLKGLVGLGSAEAVRLSQFLPVWLMSGLGLEDQLLIGQDLTVVVPIMLLCVAAVRSLSLYALQINQEATSLWVSQNYRYHLFSQIIHQPYLQIATKSSSEWMSMIMNDVLYLQSRFSEVMKSLFKDGFVIIGCLAALLFINYQATLILIACSLPVTWVLGQMSKKVGDMIHYAQILMAEIANQIIGVRKRFVHIRAQGGEAREESVFFGIVDAYLKHMLSSIKYRAAFPPLLEWFGFMGLVGFFLYYLQTGGETIFDGKYIFQFLVGLGFLIRPLRNFGEEFTKFTETMGALRQSLGLFQGPKSYEPLAPEHPGEPGEIESASANITVVKLTQLECQINGKTLVAIDREVTVRPGEMVAIVGQSGAGKSSLLKVFAGLICPTQFRGTLSWQAFASHTSYISQQAFLFTGVVAENLLYGVEDKDVSLQEAYELSVALGLDSLIKNAAQLKTMRIDALKGSVSGGELQRLTIVRGLLRNKKILLFDEASSALDLRNEERLLQLLQKRCQSLGLMCFYVTHRLQPIHPFQQVWHIDRHRLASVEICP